MYMKSPILLPVVSLVAWSLIMWAWMYAVRLPAIFKMKMIFDSNAPRGKQMDELPPNVRWKADNYNHLMEQPTIFYAIALSLSMMGEGEGLNVTMAWIYVGLRVIHSFVQSLTNHIPTRFAFFIFSTVPLIVLTVRALMCLVWGECQVSLPGVR